MTDEDIRSLSVAEILERFRRLEAELARLQSENGRLRAALDASRREGKRQAAPFSKGPPKPEPKKCGRKPGEAYGTKAFRRGCGSVDETYTVGLPPCCSHCGGELQWLKTEPQFQDEIRRESIRRRFDIEIGRCTRCHKRVQERHALQTSDALGAARNQLGPQAQALAVQMNKELGLSHGKVVRFFQTVFGIKLSRGGSAQIMLRTSKRADYAYQGILALMRQSPVVYPDETGWKVGGALQWLWTFVCAIATAYVVRPNRSFEVAAEVLGADYCGILGHDGLRSYDKFLWAAHQQCLAHIFRRCREMLETATAGAVCFPRQVKSLLRNALSLRDRRDAGEVSARGVAIVTGRLESRLDRLLTWRKTNPENERLAGHLRRHRDEWFTFLKFPGVEATNWPAEQAIRPAVVNRKVWGGNRTENGAKAQASLTSVLRTCWQQGRDPLEFLSRVLTAQAPRNRPRLFLTPALR